MRSRLARGGGFEELAHCRRSKALPKRLPHHPLLRSNPTPLPALPLPVLLPEQLKPGPRGRKELPAAAESRRKVRSRPFEIVRQCQCEPVLTGLQENTRAICATALRWACPRTFSAFDAKSRAAPSTCSRHTAGPLSLMHGGCASASVTALANATNLAGIGCIPSASPAGTRTSTRSRGSDPPRSSSSSSFGLSSPSSKTAFTISTAVSRAWNAPLASGKREGREAVPAQMPAACRPERDFHLALEQVLLGHRALSP